MTLFKEKSTTPPPAFSLTAIAVETGKTQEQKERERRTVLLKAVALVLYGIAGNIKTLGKAIEDYATV